MKICLLVIGKTDADYIRAGIEEYEKRLRKYVGYEMKVLPDVKNTKHMSEALQKEKEGLLLLEQFLPPVMYIFLWTMFPHKRRQAAKSSLSSVSAARSAIPV